VTWRNAMGRSSKHPLLGWQSLASGGMLLLFGIELLAILLGGTFLEPDHDRIWYMDAASRFMLFGSPYSPSAVAFLHPPIALLLFVPFTRLPGILWYAVPVGIVWLGRYFGGAPLVAESSSLRCVWLGRGQPPPWRTGIQTSGLRRSLRSDLPLGGPPLRSSSSQPSRRLRLLAFVVGPGG
jgi:hypothetical protein